MAQTIKEVHYRYADTFDFEGKRHTHDDIEILHVITGSGTLLKSGVLYPILDGAVYYIDASKPHITETDRTAPYICSKLHIASYTFHYLCDFTGLHPLADQLLSGAPICPGPDSAAEIDSLFKTIERWDGETCPPRHGFILGSVIRLMELCYPFRGNNVPVIYPQVNEMITYIHETSYSAYTLDGMCCALHISRYYACHLFRAGTGMTITEYVAQRRVASAKAMLREGILSVRQIADELQFSGASAFVRFFKALEGCTPTEYRLNIKEIKKTSGTAAN